MSVSCLVRSLLVIFFLLPGALWGAKAPDNPNWGSQEVLRRCWSEEELGGRDKDKVIVKALTATPRRPQMKAPLEELCPSSPAPARSIRRVSLAPGMRWVALTFDLCEGPNEITGYDRGIVNYLRQHGIHATFFAGGKWMQSHPVKTLQLMADPLFELGNHSWSHANLRLIGEKDLLEEILLPQVQYRELRNMLISFRAAQQAGAEELSKIPKIPVIFRFPYGRCSNEALKMLHRLHLAAVQWDVVSGDPSKAQTAQRIVTAVLHNVRPGSIVIFHANGRGYHTAEALPLLVSELKKRGYDFVTVSYLLVHGTAITTPDCYELKPGDNEHYDQLFGGRTGQKKSVKSAPHR